MIKRLRYGWLRLIGFGVLGFCAAWPLQVSAGGETAMDLVYHERGDRKLRLDIYYPETPPPPGGYPVLISFHGGGWIIGGRRNDLFMRPFVSDGFALVSVEYRLSGEAKYPAQIEDAREAANWIINNAERLHLDPDRMGATGMSAGGHLALLLATTQSLRLVHGGSAPLPRDAIKAVVAFYPPTDLVEIIPEAERGKPRNLIAALLGGLVTENLPMARHGSPLRYVNATSPPVFFIHGTKDRVVPLSQSRAMHHALRRAGVESWLRILEGKAHGFPPDEATLAAIAPFWQRHLGR